MRGAQAPGDRAAVTHLADVLGRTRQSVISVGRALNVLEDRETALNRRQALAQLGDWLAKSFTGLRTGSLHDHLDQFRKVSAEGTHALDLQEGDEERVDHQ